MSDNYRPTPRLKWVDVDSLPRTWPEVNEEPKAQRRCYDITWNYVLRQLWVSDVEGEEPQWRPVEFD